MKKSRFLTSLMFLMISAVSAMANEGAREAASNDLYLAAWSEKGWSEGSKMLVLTQLNGQFLMQERFQLEKAGEYGVFQLFSSRPDLKEAVLALGADKMNAVEFVFLWEGGTSKTVSLETALAFANRNDYASRSHLTGSPVLLTGLAKNMFGDVSIRGMSCEFGCDDDWDDCIGYGGQDPSEVEFCDYLWQQCWEACDSDDDGVINRDDNCVYAANPSQSDCDDDGKGDACDSNNLVTREFWGPWFKTGTSTEFDCVPDPLCAPFNMGLSLTLLYDDYKRYRIRQTIDACTNVVHNTENISYETKSYLITALPGACCNL